MDQYFQRRKSVFLTEVNLYIELGPENRREVKERGGAKRINTGPSPSIQHFPSNTISAIKQNEHLLQASIEYEKEVSLDDGVCIEGLRLECRIVV